MTDRRRWDSDTLGTGVRDAVSARGPVEALVHAMSQPGWVTEAADLHLLPHLRFAATRDGVEITRADVVDDVLELTVAIGEPRPADARRVVVRLVAAIAESSTHIRELPERTFEVVTGTLEGDGRFAPHGHLVRLRVV